VTLLRIGVGWALCALLISTGGIARGASVLCAAPHLRASTLVTGALGPAARRIGPDWVALDAQGDIAWSEQGAPGVAGRLFAYDPRTGRAAVVPSAHVAGGERIGLISVSPRWVAFGLFVGIYDGGNWQIVVRDRSTGRERVAASSLYGGIDSARFDLDGDTLAWVQPLFGGGGEVHVEDLRTRRQHVLATTKDGVYTQVQVGGGHVLWQWIHQLHGATVSDLLLAPASGGPVAVLPRVLLSAEQARLDWPRVAYIEAQNARRMFVVLDLRTLHRTEIPAGRDDDFPQLSGMVLLTRAMGEPSLFNVATGQHVVLRRDAQYTLGGALMVTRHLADGLLAAVGNDSSGQHYYVLAISRLSGADPLDSVLTCAGQ